MKTACAVLGIWLLFAATIIAAGQGNKDRAWRPLPLIKEGKVDPAWKQIGGGKFVVDDGALRTLGDKNGMGMLLHAREKFGNCQIRVVYRAQEPRSNSGVFVRIDDGVVKFVDAKEVRRKLSLEQMQEASEKELGAWYPVHRGYEVQISEAGDAYHRTGSIYSLSKGAPLPKLKPDGWRTMVITLKGTIVHVDVDGSRTSTFDSEAKDLPKRKQWYEPKREPKRPPVGYIGLQNHDPGDVVWFKEVSVRGLPAAETNAAPKLPIGKETTYVNGPLDKEGYIDYEAALNDRLGEGITPERNANVLLWKAVGPAPSGGVGMPAEYFKRLGIAEPPKSGAYFIGLHAYLKDHLKLETGALDALNDQQNQTCERPWVEKEYPHIAAWLKDNEKPLAQVVEASRRPDYFNPLVSRRDEKDPGSLLGALLPTAQKCRELTMALTARAMLRVGEAKFDEAWRDLLACHRLGRLVARGATLIEALVGMAIDSIARNADLAYLDRANLSSSQAQDRLKDLQDLAPMPPIADTIQLGERIMCLESLQLVRRRGIGILEGFTGGKVKEPTADELKVLDKIDWEVPLRDANRWYERLTTALRLKDRVEREKACRKIEEDLKALKKEAATPANLTKLPLGKGPPDKMAGKAIGNILISLLLPSTVNVRISQDRTEQQQRNLHVAFALAVYRRDHERYPAKLDALAPKYLASVPNDLFSGKALIYKSSLMGYFLYSVGVNGKDEGGRSYDDDPAGDDLPVRMPLPELKRKP